MDITQGGLAASSGNTLEQAVMAALGSKGFSIAVYRDYVKNKKRYGKRSPF